MESAFKLSFPRRADGKPLCTVWNCKNLAAKYGRRNYPTCEKHFQKLPLTMRNSLNSIVHSQDEERYRACFNAAASVARQWLNRDIKRQEAKLIKAKVRAQVHRQTLLDGAVKALEAKARDV